MAGKADQGDVLRQAARVNSVDKIKEQLSKGIDANAHFIGFTPLRLASMYGHKEACQMLLEADARDDLHAAAARGDTEAMEELVAAGHGDPTLANRGGETALMWASAGGHAEAIKLLLRVKANVNARDQHGFTALMGASQGGHLDAMRTLLTARADVNAKEPEDSETALIMAEHNARNDAVALLLECGAQRPDEPEGARSGTSATAKQSE